MMRWSILFAMAGCVAADVQPVVDLEDPVAVADISDPDTGASDTDEPSDPIVTETPLVSDCPSFPITEWIDPNRPFDATAVAPGDLLELFIKEGEPMWGQDMKAHLCDASGRTVPFKYVAGADSAGMDFSYLTLHNELTHPVDAVLVMDDGYGNQTQVSERTLTIQPDQPMAACSSPPIVMLTSSDPFTPSVAFAGTTSTIVFGTEFDASTRVEFVTYPDLHVFDDSLVDAYAGALVITPSRDAEDTFVEIRVITDCGEHYVEGYWLSVI